MQDGCSASLHVIWKAPKDASESVTLAYGRLRDGDMKYKSGVGGTNLKLVPLVEPSEKTLRSARHCPQTAGIDVLEDVKLGTAAQVHHRGGLLLENLDNTGDYW